MKPLRMLAATAAIVACAAALALPALQAYTTSGYKWATLNVPFYVNPANKDVSSNAAIAAIQAGIDAWNSQAGTPFRYYYAGQVSSTTVGYNGKNLILFRGTDNGGSIATSYWWHSNGSLVESDLIFWDGGWTFFTGQSGCNSGAYIEDVTTHELGHSLGLRHSSVTEASMYGTYSRCSQALRTLASDDKAGAQALYGKSATTDTAPIVKILSPANGASVSTGTAIAFSGSAMDTPDGDISSRLVWRSSIDGQIGTGSSFSRTLTAGSHTISATVTDSTKHTTSASISVSVTQSSTTTVATLTARALIGYDGSMRTKLTWSGLSAATVDVYRNGVKLRSIENDGLANDHIYNKGTYNYKLCSAGTATCTNQATVTF